MGFFVAVVCFILSASMLISILKLKKRAKKMNKLIQCVDQIRNEETFFPMIEEYISTIADPEFVNKGRILKVWGLIKFSHDYSEIEEAVNAVELKELIIDPRNSKKNKIGLNEDSFYYLCFACSFKAYSYHDEKLLQLLNAKTEEKSDYFQDQLFYYLYKATWDWYHDQNDRGEKVFMEVIQGPVEKMRCSRQMLNIYRNIASAFLAGIAQKTGNSELREKVGTSVANWSATEMGRNILNDLGIEEKGNTQIYEKQGL